MNPKVPLEQFKYWIENGMRGKMEGNAPRNLVRMFWIVLGKIGGQNASYVRARESHSAIEFADMLSPTESRLHRNLGSRSGPNG